MLRKLAFALGMSCLLALPSGASEPGGAVSGYVRNSAGAPQMGALVELIGSASHVLKLFTDEHGFYSAKGLLPGTYSLQVYATSYLPTLKEKIGLKPGSSLALNVTVSSLFDAVQLKSPGRSIEDEEDWKWVLRSTSNRPVLRLQNVGTKASASHSPFAFRQLFRHEHWVFRGGTGREWQSFLQRQRWIRRYHSRDGAPGGIQR